MIIYNQTSTSRKYIGGILIGLLIGPAIYLFIQGLIFYGVVLVIIYLAFETYRTGVDFDFENAKFTHFRELLFVKIQQGGSMNLDSFSHYRVNQESFKTNVSANYVQNSTISQEQHTLELLNKHKGEFVEIVKSNNSKLQPLLIQLEEENIVLVN